MTVVTSPNDGEEPNESGVRDWQNCLSSLGQLPIKRDSSECGSDSYLGTHIHGSHVMGPISYWNAYVAVTQMGGQGNFSDPRLGIDVKHSPDMVTPKLAALRAYQFSLPSPPAPARSFDGAIAERGRLLFDRTCATCHVDGAGSDNNSGKLHAPTETGVDGAYAARTGNKAYRTTPLRAPWQHPPYFHDGSAATLADVVAHYNQVRTLALTAAQQRDLVEYLKSL